MNKKDLETQLNFFKQQEDYHYRKYIFKKYEADSHKSRLVDYRQEISVTESKLKELEKNEKEMDPCHNLSL